MFLFNAKNILKNHGLNTEIPSNRDFLASTVRIAWPAALESFLMALTVFVDTIMVGSLGSYAIAAIGLTNQPKFICLAVFIALSTAISAVTARRKGEEKQDAANQVLLQSIFIIIILGVCITTLALIFSEQILLFAGSQADTHEESVAYFRIIIAGLLFQALTMGINAAQRGVGKTRISMRANVSMSLVNVLFNYLLIGGNFGFPALGVTGAAIATLLGFFTGFIVSLTSVLRKKEYLYLLCKSNTLKFKAPIYRSLYKVGSGTFVEQAFLRIGFLLTALVIANLGTTAFAAHQIGMTIITISFSIGDGLSVASVSLVGQSLGQKRTDLARVYGSFCQQLGFLFSLIIAIVYIIFGEHIYSLFATDTAILEYGSIIMKLVAFIVMLQIAQLIFGGCLRGAGDTKYTAFVSLVSVAFIRPFSSWLFVYPLGMGLIGAWVGLLLDQIVRFNLTRHRFKGGKWQKIDI